MENQVSWTGFEMSVPSFMTLLGIEEGHLVAVKFGNGTCLVFDETGGRRRRVGFVSHAARGMKLSDLIVREFLDSDGHTDYMFCVPGDAGEVYDSV